MKRDMDLVRAILFAIEESESSNVPTDLSIPNYSKMQIDYHLELLSDANLINSLGITPATERSYSMATPRRLTWQGHEFLDAIRNETVWNKTKEVVKEKGGGLAFGIIRDLAIQIARQMVGLP
jgi:hypothetical protein